jgi:hypothetical protein
MELIHRRQWAAAVQHSLPKMPERLQAELPRDYRRLPEIREQAKNCIEKGVKNAIFPDFGRRSGRR